MFHVRASVVLTMDDEFRKVWMPFPKTRLEQYIINSKEMRRIEIQMQLLKEKRTGGDLFRSTEIQLQNIKLRDRHKILRGKVKAFEANKNV